MVEPDAATELSSLEAVAETARLEVLFSHEILDTAPEVAFDQVVEMAQASFGTSIVLLSLVDERRQWFKARVGLDLTETSREVAFCDYTIQGNDVMVVPNARTDPRFADNPLVTDAPRIRFYAGAPIFAPEGACLGSLDVISNRPRRRFSGHDRQRLQVLAGIASAALESRKQMRLARHDANDLALLAWEVEHRVGSSLRIVCDVLEAQAARASTQASRKAFLSAADRIAELESLHYQLCDRTGTFEDDTHAYLLALLGSLQEAMLGTAGGHKILLIGERRLTLSTDRLARLGMIVTELVFNAIVHGHGDILVGIERRGEFIEISVSDQNSGRREHQAQLLSVKRPGLQIVALLARPGGLRADPSRPGGIVVDMAII